MELFGVVEGMKYCHAQAGDTREEEFPSAKLTPAREVRMKCKVTGCADDLTTNVDVDPHKPCW
jgi:hypothetical protein